MKKISAIILAVALIVMACVPFCASADDKKVTLSMEKTDITVEDGTFTVVVNYEATGALYNSGKILVGFDTEKVEIIPNADGNVFTKAGAIAKGVDSVSSSLPSATYKLDTSAGKGLTIAFASAGEIESKENVVTLKLRFKEGVTAEENVAFTLKVLEFGTYVDPEVGGTGEDVAASSPVVDSTVNLAEPTVAPTEAPTTAAPTEAPTTKAPVAGGEATPWALMATVAVAGAALVVLSTKKSK